MRFRLLLIGVGAVLVALTFTFPLWAPLLESEEAAPEERFPGLSAQLQEAFQLLPQEQQAAYFTIAETDRTRAARMIEAALSGGYPAPESEMEMPTLSGPVVAATGNFQQVDAVRWAQGTVTIYRQADDTKLMRFEDFSTVPGPDVRVFLSASPVPLTEADLRARGIELDLGQLVGTSGNQNYPIPREVNLADYASVVLYSPSLEMVYSYAPLFLRQ